jgi:hypothetical protein
MVKLPARVVYMFVCRAKTQGAKFIFKASRVLEMIHLPQEGKTEGG